MSRRDFSELRTGNPVMMFLLAGLLCGCASTRLQESFDSAMRIEERCAAIEEATYPTQPAADQEKNMEVFRQGLLNALSLRLIGVCAEEKCDVEDNTRARLIKIHASINKLKESVGAALASAKNAVMSEKNQRVANIAGATDDLKKVIDETISQETLLKSIDIGAKLKEVENILKSGVDIKKLKCVERSICIRNLAELANSIEGKAQETYSALDEYVKAGSAIKENARLIQEARNNILIAPTDKNLKEPFAEIIKNLGEAEREAKDLMAVLEDLENSISIFKRSFWKLRAGDIDYVLNDVFAAKIYAKVAERTLVLLERSLQPVDRLADKIDDKGDRNSKSTVNRNSTSTPSPT